MRLLMYVSLFLLILSGCKSEDMGSKTEYLQMLEGSWKKVEMHSGLTNTPNWTNLPDSMQVVIRFRSDGVLIDDQGHPKCCRPTSYIVNSELTEVSSNSDANPNCDSIYCVECQVWEMKLTSDELVISNCVSANGKYRKL